MVLAWHLEAKATSLPEHGAQGGFEWSEEE